MDETANVARRASGQDEAGPSRSSIQTTTATTDSKAQQFFFDHFVTQGNPAYLQGVTTDDFLLKPITACALAAIANRDNDDEARKLAGRYYVEAINATNAALKHTRKVKKDSTLISVYLLSMFERISWEPGGQSLISWKQFVYQGSHVQGSANILQLRGQAQLRTKAGMDPFREVRSNIINNALECEIDVPAYLVQWTQGLAYDEFHTPTDRLAVLAASMASLRAAFRGGLRSDEELMVLANRLENDLLRWSENTLAAGSVWSFDNVRDLDSLYSYGGMRHKYGVPSASRTWNTWRCLRILLSRLQEALWRRSWFVLAQPTQPVLDSQHFSDIRTRMVNDTCIAAAYVFGNDYNMDPPLASVSSAYHLAMPLYLAGTCLLERLIEPVVTLGGSRMILVDKPMHDISLNETSVQLAWIVERLDYMAHKVGFRCAAADSSFLKGGSRVYFDLARSVVIRSAEDEAQAVADLLDLEGLAHSSVPGEA